MWILEIYDLATDSLVGNEKSEDMKDIEKIIEKYRDNPTIDFYVYKSQE